MLRIIGLLSATLCIASPASAMLRTFDFVARVDQTAAIVSAGTLVRGSFSFDDALSPKAIYPGVPGTTALYEDPSITLRIRFAGADLSGTARATVFDYSVPPITLGDDDGDAFDLYASVGDWGYDLTIWQPDRAWLSSTALPSSFPSPLWQGPFADPNDDDSLTVPHGEFFAWNGRTMQGVSAIVLSVSPAGANYVPEPASWAMMICGFGMTGSTLRRRKSVTALTALR